MSADEMLIDTLVGRIAFALVNRDPPDADLDREIRWALNEVLLDLVTRSNHWGMRSDGLLELSEGVADYSLADDFHAMIDSSVVFTTNAKNSLKYIPETDFNDMWLQGLSSTGRPTHYFVRSKSQSTGAAQVRFWPTPSQADTIMYRYRSMPTQVWATVRGSGEVIDRRFPMEHIPTLVHGTVVMFPQFLNAPDLQVHQSKYEQGVLKMKQKANPIEGAVYQRKNYPDLLGRGRSGGGAWWGGAISGP